MDTLTLIEDKSGIEKDEIRILDFSDLKFALRRFPFDKPRPLHVLLEAIRQKDYNIPF